MKRLVVVSTCLLGTQVLGDWLSAYGYAQEYREVSRDDGAGFLPPESLIEVTRS